MRTNEVVVFIKVDGHIQIATQSGNHWLRNLVIGVPGVVGRKTQELPRIVIRKEGISHCFTRCLPGGFSKAIKTQALRLDSSLFPCAPKLIIPVEDCTAGPSPMAAALVLDQKVDRLGRAVRTRSEDFDVVPTRGKRYRMELVANGVSDDCVIIAQ